MTYKVVARAGLIRDKGASLSKIGAQLVEALLLSEDDIIREAYDADAVMAGANDAYSKRVIEALSKCKVISRFGVGYSNIDLAAATEQGIPVAYVPDASITEVSDHAIALLLSFSRKLFPICKAVREGAWQPGKTIIPTIIRPIRRLSEQTLGLVGLGRIGSTVCRKARALVMRTIVYDPYLSQEAAEALGAEKVNFERLLAESDYISLHAPLTLETRHIFGLEQFKKMKPTAYIINTARGGLIDEAALIAAVSGGYIAGAGLDVTDPEPPRPDNPLINMENVIMTAHTSYYSERSASELARCAAEAVIAALTGQWPSHIANPEVKDRTNCRLRAVV